MDNLILALQVIPPGNQTWLAGTSSQLIPEKMLVFLCWENRLDITTPLMKIELDGWQKTSLSGGFSIAMFDEQKATHSVPRSNRLRNNYANQRQEKKPSEDHY